MELVNQTNVAAGWTMGFARDGREIVIVAIKATFAIPRNGEEPQFASEQVPLTEADQFTGEPGRSAPLHESDYAHHKPMCDVLLNGSAYAPPGKRTDRVTVGVRVGPLVKTFSAVGDRVWRVGMTGVRATDPEPFDALPISYDNAFGGTDDSKGDPANVMTFLENPVGRGFWHYRDKADGRRLPNTEELERRVMDPSGAYRPMSFGPIGRNWRPRIQHAGTYDQRWLDERAPFWPDDFDYGYFQAAPPDQQIPYPTGGEPVVLRNLTPDGHVAFNLPKRSMPVRSVWYQTKDTLVDAVLDSILIEPDLGIFMLGWRAVLPMRRSCFDVKQVIAGEVSDAWRHAQKYGNKPYYKGLAELARARRGEA